MKTLYNQLVNRPETVFFTLFATLLQTNLNAQSICFTSHNDYAFSGTSNAQCIEYGDFNNDGVQDIVEGNFTIGANKMVFIEGNADGTFEAPVIFEGGSRPLDVKAYDFNQDSNLDLVIANQWDADMSIVFGNGDGTFQAPIVYATNTSPNDIALADFNEDGAMDIAVSCLSGGFNLFLGSVAVPGDFSMLAYITTGAGARGIVAADFNQDNHMDVATANNSAASMTIKHGDGTGSFGAATNIAAQSGTFSIQQGDFNNDGWIDLAATNETANSLTVALNSGVGFFFSINYPTKTSPNGLKVGDFNEDNLPDIALVAFADNVVSVYEGIGAGFFGAAQHFTAIGAPRDLVVYDCNGDTHLDIVISTNVGQVLPVFLGLGTGDFQRRVSFPVGNGAESVRHGDLNGDGFEDLVVANKLDNNVEVLLNDGLGAFTSLGTYSTDLAPSDLWIADVNEDLFLDVVTANNTNGTISVLTGNGTGALGALGNYNCNAQPVAIQMADFNNDGNIDVAVLNATQNFNILFGTGTGVFGSPVTYTSGNNPSDVVLADFNNDNFTDIAFSLRGNGKVGVALNNGSGGFGATVQFNVGTQPTGIASADLNNDGNKDLVVSNYGSNNFSRLLGNGTGAFSPALHFSSTDTGPMDVELKDFNSDGNIDVIGVCEVSVASTGYAPVFTGAGNGTFTFYKRFSVDMGPEMLTVADLDSDGRFDAAVVNKVSKSVSVLKNTTAHITANGPTDYCEGDNTYLISSPADVYAWSSLETVQQINPVASGTYYVETTTGFSSWCSSQSNEITLTVSPSPVLVVSPGVTICSGQSTILTATGADSYTWAGGLGTNDSITVSPSTSQWYAVTGSLASGCSKTDSVYVEVTSLPDASFTLLEPTYCQNEPVVTLVPVTTGGVFSGPGVIGDQLDPALIASGIINVEYYIDLGGSCTNTSVQTTEIVTSPDASFTGLSAMYCANDAPVLLIPQETGGTFSGVGVSGSEFSPAMVGSGNFNVQYSITNGQGCTDQYSVNTTVFSLPDAGFSGLDAQYCANDAGVVLSPVTGGGVFSGLGVSGTNFDPTQAGTGSVTVSYSLTDANGCTATTNEVTEVLDAPDASFSGLAATYCADESNALLTPVDGGGAFSGSGITGSEFSPSAVSSGTYSITYTVSNGQGCTAQSVQNTEVMDVPDASFSGLGASYCSNDNSVTLAPQMNGGTFSGSGIVGTVFDPSLASAGSVSIAYTVTNANNCTATTTASTIVVAAPDSDFSGLNADYCADAPVVQTLMPNTSGGTFSGSGISGDTFNSSTAGLGAHTVTYTISQSGCTSVSQLTTTVHDTPDATYSGLLTDYCEENQTVDLVPVVAGGTFTGAGTGGLTFDPASAGVGTHTITYTLVGSGGCTGQSTQTTTVTALPNADFSGLNASYCASTTSTSVLTPVTAGGAFSGPGITGNEFNTALSGSGTHTINYTVTISGCTSTMSYQTIVGTSPDASFSGLQTSYCTSASVVPLTPIVNGGTFSGSGVLGASFNPSTAGSGVHTVSYTVTDINGCTGTSNQTVQVFNTPDASFTGLDANYCNDDADVVLIPMQTGGVFSGSGIFGNTFSPASAGLGLVTISYEIADPNCPAQTSVSTYIFAPPLVNFSGLEVSYCSGDVPDALTGSPTGGVFSGTGINGVLFQPLGLSGNQTVTYNYTDANGCSNAISQTTHVFTSPDASFTGLQTNYCSDEDISTLTPTQSGGVFLGNGVQNNFFNPGLATTGSNTVTYSITNADGCTSEEVQNTSVYQEPDMEVTLIGETLNAVPQSGVTYQWIDCNTMTQIAGETGLSYLPEGMGSYAVIIENAGCSDTSECISYTLDLEHAGALIRWKLYPNPTSGKIVVEVPTACALMIYDATGRIVLSHELVNEKNDVDLSEYLVDGVYKVTLIGEDWTESCSIVLMNR